MDQEQWMLMSMAQQEPSTALRNVMPAMERYGLRMSEAQMLALKTHEGEALQESGRVELGQGILPKLLYAFCDSPYLDGQNLTETIGTLLDTFYYCKNEAEEAVSDDELVEAMAACFNGAAQGSAEFMSELTLGELLRCRKQQGEA